jgi:hypothetical protein
MWFIKKIVGYICNCLYIVVLIDRPAGQFRVVSETVAQTHMIQMPLLVASFSVLFSRRTTTTSSIGQPI